MTNLKILDISDNYGVKNKTIENLKLLKLKCKNNPNIIDVSMIKTLCWLDISGVCGVDQKGISGLNLFSFYYAGNDKILETG